MVTAFERNTLFQISSKTAQRRSSGVAETDVAEKFDVIELDPLPSSKLLSRSGRQIKAATLVTRRAPVQLQPEAFATLNGAPLQGSSFDKLYNRL